MTVTAPDTDLAARPSLALPTPPLVAPTDVHGDDRRTPVLLITDIGADIDDTQALLTIVGSPNLRLVGVVTSVGDGVARACVVRFWLRLLGYADADVPVLPSVDAASAGCVPPPGTPAPADAALGALEDTPRAIAELARAHGSRLAVVGIAALTPLARALRDVPGALDALRGVGRVFLQGQCVVDAATGRLAPDAQAYNFRTDLAAAADVLDALQAHVPLRFLGKHAAYRVGVTQAELASLERGGGALPSVRDMARAQMDGFRRANPELFYKIYAVPVAHRSLATQEWVDHLPGDVISHPYDPLLALALAEEVGPLPRPFERPLLGGAAARRVARATTPRGVDELALAAPPVFERLAVGAPVGARFGERHTTIGNAPESAGVPDVLYAKQMLVAAMNRAVDRFCGR